MKRTNPTLRADVFSRFRGMPLDPAGQMTLTGTINKTLTLTVVAFLFAAVNWTICYSMPSLGIGATIIGVFAGLGVAIWTCVQPQQAPFTAPVYAAVEGLVLGGISALYSYRYAGIVQAAIPLTFGVMFAMLVLYRTGVIKATPLFVKVVVLSTIGVCLFGLLNLIVYLTMGQTAFVPGDPLSIGISLFICVIASLNFIIDFAFIEQGAAEGAPKYMEWYGAFALCVTLFWLYFQILRLLRLLRR